MPSSPKTFRRAERAKEREQFRGNCVERGYDWQWMKISKLYRDATPVCEVCKAAVAVDVDHKEAFNGINDPKRTAIDNLQSICRQCHNKKTHR